MISATDLPVANHLENLGGDERDRFRVIQLQAAGAALSRELAGRKNQQLVDFARSEMHAFLCLNAEGSKDQPTVDNFALVHS